jgi:hypothetical protein
LQAQIVFTMPVRYLLPVLLAFAGLPLSAQSIDREPPVSPPDTLQPYPNPSITSFTLKYGNLAPEELWLYAANGQLLLHWTALPEEQVEVPVADLPAALYEVVLVTGRVGRITKKVCVVR